MNIPDFSKPSEDAGLTTDAAGQPLKVGDLVYSNMIPMRGSREPAIEIYSPVEEYEGRLIIRHGGSFMLSYFVSKYTYKIPLKN